MRSYFVKRFLFMIPTFFGITLLTFFMMMMAPKQSNHMQLLFAGSGLSPEQVLQIKQTETPQYDLSEGYRSGAERVAGWFGNDSQQVEGSKVYRGILFVGQNIKDYFRWLWKMVRFDFGYSSEKLQPVSTLILKALPWTLLINFLSLLLIYGVSLPLGIWSARHNGHWFERWTFFKLFALYAMPSFWIASLFLVFLAGGDYLNLFPLGGTVSDVFEELSFGQKILDVAWHLFLPVLVTSLSGFAFMTRFAKANFLEVLQKDFIRTAYAKGLPVKKIMYRHALKNALLPFVTLMGTLLPAMIGGSVIVEQIFAIPGMGYLGFEAVLTNDYNVVMAIATLSAILTLFGLFLQDVLYTKIDPRIRFS